MLPRADENCHDISTSDKLLNITKQKIMKKSIGNKIKRKKKPIYVTIYGELNKQI